jgi:hypothetical protein
MNIANPTLPSTGDHAKVAMRVVSLDRVSQVLGSYAIIKFVPVKQASAGLGHPKWLVVEVSRTMVRLVGEFSFVGVDGPIEEQIDTSDPRIFFRVDAKFVVEYTLEAGDAPADQDLAAFAAINGTLNVYPFWREYVASCLARAGLPSILLPVFNPLKHGVAGQPTIVRRVETTRVED